MIVRCHLDLEAIANFCDGLESHTNVKVTGALTKSLEGSWDLMARDIPSTGRRYTNLTTGTEVFDLEKFLAVFDAVTKVSVRPDGEDTAIVFEVRPR